MSDLDILKTLRLVPPDRDNELTLGAILLFGASESLGRFVPSAEAVFHELKQGTIVADETLRQPLLRTAERLYDLLAVRNSEQELMIGLHRLGVPRVPDGPEAWRLLRPAS